uniref:Uncharacterized protein n=1 Tax=Arundo donax TaxID=35708 RepID=A0A0A9F758_ARUDO
MVTVLLGQQLLASEDFAAWPSTELGSGQEIMHFGHLSKRSHQQAMA